MVLRGLCGFVKVSTAKIGQNESKRASDLESGAF